MKHNQLHQPIHHRYAAALGCVKRYVNMEYKLKSILAIIIWSFFSMSNAQAGNMPIEITNLENAFNSVPGVKDPGVGKGNKLDTHKLL